MDKKYYLAIDIGASSGRHMLGHMEDGKMILEEVYRFPNGFKDVGGEKVWDIDGLFAEIKTGMKRCKDLGKIPVSVGIDTWAVDFVLLDEQDERIGNAVCYRDERTLGMDEKVYEVIPQEKLYSSTGIQKQIFNSIYQLMAIKEKKPDQLKKAKSFLMIPDYLNFLLTGKKAQEYTNATTTQLVNPRTCDWDYELIKALGFPKEMFLPISMPGEILGGLKKEIAEELGLDCKVVLPATHDTGSAVVAVPSNDENTLYISSGTWSLMGTEILKADCSKEAMEKNFTNEGGYQKRYRFLKNIMGLWMIQSVKAEIGRELSYGTICDMASKSFIPSVVNANDNRFLAPKNMTKEVQRACEESGQQVPEGIAEVATVIYNSLARCYAITISELEEQTGKTFDTIHVVGGGANADYLNRLTAFATGRKLLAGPTEATAIGNLAVQMITAGVFSDLSAARACIRNSFEIKEY